MSKRKRDATATQRRRVGDGPGRRWLTALCFMLPWAPWSCAATGGSSHEQASHPSSPRSTSVAPVLVATVDCYARARNIMVSEAEAWSLCYGASTAGPVDCYEAAETESLLSTPELIELCRCASSIEPADCFADVDENTYLYSDQIIRICSPVGSGEVDPYCRPYYQWFPAPY